MSHQAEHKHHQKEAHKFKEVAKEAKKKYVNRNEDDELNITN